MDLRDYINKPGALIAGVEGIPVLALMVGRGGRPVLVSMDPENLDNLEWVGIDGVREHGGRIELDPNYKPAAPPLAPTGTDPLNPVDCMSADLVHTWFNADGKPSPYSTLVSLRDITSMRVGEAYLLQTLRRDRPDGTPCEKPVHVCALSVRGNDKAIPICVEQSDEGTDPASPNFLTEEAAKIRTELVSREIASRWIEVLKDA